MKITVEVSGPSIADQVSKNISAVIAQVNTAVTAALNMCRGMIEQQARAQILGSGRFGDEWASGLHVTLDNMRISMTHDKGFADIFETGGTITGHPLLWLPIGGSGRGGAMVSAKGTKRPYMLSLADKTPALFGIASVTIPKKWDLNGVVQSVMANFGSYFSQAMSEGA